MRMRSGFIAATLACVLIGWWLAHPASRLPVPDPAAVASMPSCPLPPRVTRGAAPLQSDVPRDLALPNMGDATLTPLAGISVDARVLSRENYRLGREADFSPSDLALGWDHMREDAILAKLSISQSGRWYHYRWQGDPPLALDEIVRSSANMHMVPANDAVARALGGIETGQHVRIDGWLVRIQAKDGWRWASSLTREDSGDGACELVYVCAVTSL